MPLRHLYAVVAVAAACASETIPGPPSGLPYAAATPACGPADGPAVTIYLAPSPVASLDLTTPFLRIAIWQPLGQLGGRTWQLADGEVAAEYFSTPDEFESASGGSVTVSGIDRDTTVRGTAVLTFPTRGTIAGGFYARWFPVVLRCG